MSLFSRPSKASSTQHAPQSCQTPESIDRSGNQPSDRAINKRFLEEEILPHVFKPARYLGLEQGTYHKSFDRAAVRMAVAFPDLYEIGFSNYALKMLYSLVNQQPDYMCDRVYAPAPDFKEQILTHQLPLYGVESFVPLKHFDVLAFSLQYELNYTTIFGLLETAQIPFRSADRHNANADYPLLIAGGPGSANPMPLAPFFDAFIIGDGEEVLLEALATIRQGKKERLPKAELLKRLGQLEGLYIPGVTEKAYKRIVDIAENPVDVAPLIPLIGAVHDRITVEARRGCDRMCRFCQPCFINLPVREQSIENIKQSALKEIQKTGYEECSLLSLSIADYSYFKPLILEVAEALAEENVSLSLPSQRADRFSLDVAEAVQSIRKSTLTFAPEAGTARLRDVINKNLSDAEIMNAVTTAYRAGWNKVKLYFMIGLPTETHDDLDGIVDLIRRMQQACLDIKREPGLSMKHFLDINVTLSNFVPKPHTPFQWFPQDTMEQLYHKIEYLKEKFKPFRGVKLNFTDPEISKLEAVISRAGTELADVIEAAYRKGAYLDAWDDLRNFDRWFEALAEKGIHYEAYTRDRCCDLDEALPWDAIDVGLTKSWLQEEYKKATQASSTTPCFETCSVCGVCGAYSTWPKFIETPTFKNVKRIQNSVDQAMGEPEVPNNSKDPVCKVRVTLQKLGDLRFISHLDWLRMVYRAIARSKLPVAYSKGFNPRPKIGFSPALPLFTQAEAEYLDIELVTPVTGVRERLNAFLPPQSQITEEVMLPLSVPSIDMGIEALQYRASYSTGTTCTDPQSQVNMSERIAFLKSQSTLPVEVEVSQKSGHRKRTTKKVLDLVPYLEALEVDGNGDVSFTLRRLKPEGTRPIQSGTSQPENADQTNGVETGNDDSISPSTRPQSGQNIEESDVLSLQPTLEAGPGSVKPSWVLDLINPNVQWSLTRSCIVLDTKSKPKPAALSTVCSG
ncbi:TIGR03960 family B12-binding radical SAM protein [Vampirovibrio chlorellavorus]|uniref:TIGR03960 family B12-binding radical SAM protein n=1 Tax=Vampirovibrio chlorellavorus TaxID=758823 RepID=UPI0026EDB460|nr:TIGR03960 family B12-binding radical SAM protein [Vampirovibrio chlorellavorus]